MNRLDKAIADFEDETLDATLGERISWIRQALSWAAFEGLKRANSKHKKTAQENEEESRQIECAKWFKELEKFYVSQLKMNKITGKTEAISDNEWLKQYRESHNSLGSIVRNMNEKTA